MMATGLATIQTHSAIMSLSTWLAFFVASWLISLSPGPGALSCMASGLKYGWRKALWNILGLITGIMVMMTLVAVGIGAAIAASVLAFTAIKWFGVAYLVWLGIRKWRDASVAPRDAGTPSDDGRRRALFRQGFLVNISNPKGLIFMVAVLPQFINPHAPQFMQYVVCGATLMFTDWVVMNGYTLFAAKLLRYLREPHHILWTNRIFGGLFVAAGGLLAVFKRGS